MPTKTDLTYMAESMGPGMFGLRWFNPYRLVQILQQEFMELDDDQRVSVDYDDHWIDFPVRDRNGGSSTYRLYYVHPKRDEDYNIELNIRFEHVRWGQAANDRIDLTIWLTRELEFKKARTSVRWCGNIVLSPLELTYETLEPQPPDRSYVNGAGLASVAVSLSSMLCRLFSSGNGCDAGGQRFPRMTQAVPEAFAECWEEPLRQ